MEIIERLESDVRSYCRSWPTVFASARGCTLQDRDGRQYLDFFAGAGALNYGHNHPAVIDPLVEHLRSGGIVHGLDMATDPKIAFLERFEQRVLAPRDMDHKVQFPGPTGTNAVEAALKLARKVTGRDRVIAFTNAFHGMTLGSLAVTGNSMKRRGAGVPLGNVDSMPFDGFFGADHDTIGFVEALLAGDGSGIDLPAAVILETVQAEGGINPASTDWLQRLADLCRRHDILMIVDDIQVGCGRTGPFFSFEPAGIDPDIVCLSKSLSGSGLPMAVTLLKPHLDVWEPGEHNGTFRGNNAAFVTATAALECFWSDSELSDEVVRKGDRMDGYLRALAAEHDGLFAEVRGRGMIRGIVGRLPETAEAIAAAAFDRGLIVETAGPNDEVLKLLPPLIVSDAEMDRAFEILDESVDAVLDRLGDDLIAGEEPAEEVAT